MIRKLLTYCAVFLAGTAMMNAQNPLVSILGGSTSVGWTGDLDMSTTDGVHYTYSGLVVTVPPTDAGVKFRQDHDWPINWGAATFPSGTGVLNGANIPATNGTWDVTFDISTGAYTFSPPGVVFDTVTLTGGGITASFSTLDGENYFADNVTLGDGDYFFSVNAEGQWGSTGFPTGTAIEGGLIPVPENAYNITFNTETGAYAFNYVTVSITGDGLINWDTDVDLDTTDGVNYTKTDQAFAGGEIKFRLNHLWVVSWGSGTYPSGTLTSPGENFVVPAGTYDVSFNRTSAEFAFTTEAGIEVRVKNSIIVYPNPATSVWNFSGNDEITTIQVVDLTGKTILTQNFGAQAATVNASGFASGIYFAKVTSAKGVSVVRIVKN